MRITRTADLVSSRSGNVGRRRLAMLIGTVVILSLVSAPASATTVTSCAWNADVTYKSDLENAIFNSGGGLLKWGVGETWGRLSTDACLVGRNWYQVGVAASMWTWNMGTPSVCDQGTNGAYVTSTTGDVWTDTSCANNGQTKTSATNHRFWISGTPVESGLVLATE